MTTEPTGHLPECICQYTPHSSACPSCICDRLRACEARVREVYESSDDYMLGIAVGMHNGWLEGHAAALDAARDQITARMATEPDIPRRTGMGYAVEEINRLREAKP